MKNRAISLSIVLLLIASILVSFSYMKVSSEEDLYGIWEGEHQGLELLFSFNPDGTCTLSFENTTNGEVYEYSGTYEVNFSKEPIPLSIRNIPQLNHALYTIIKCTNNESLVMADFVPRWRLRPISFNYDTSMNLRRAAE